MSFIDEGDFMNEPVFVFPGQGIDGLEILAELPGESFNTEAWSQVCDLLSCDLNKSAEGIDMSKNEIASLLTVFASVIQLKRAQHLWSKVECFAGYSVGQLTALFAAGILKEQELFELVYKRAMAMNESMESHDRRLGMLACIGLSQDVVLQEIKSGSFDSVSISNINGPGQLTLAGSIDELEAISLRLKESKAKKTMMLQVEGAWHSFWLKTAQSSVEKLFAETLTKAPTISETIKVACNVTGNWLPLQNTNQMSELMGRHVCEAVQWDACVRSCIAAGGKDFIEVGAGRVLTRFGFFIDRSVPHRHL